MKTEEKEIKEFLTELSGKEPVPSGGGALALSGALSASLALMVVNMTRGKKRYAAYEERLNALADVFAADNQAFLALADADEEVFLPLSKAYGLPKDTEEEKAFRAQTMERCLRDACAVPMRVLKQAYAMTAALSELKEICSRLVISDVGVAAKLLETVLNSAFLNVVINAKDLPDGAGGRALYEEARRLRDEGTRSTAETYAVVAQQLSAKLEDRS